MQYAFAHQGRPQGIGKGAVLLLAGLLVIFSYTAYLWIQKDVTIVIDGKAVTVKTFKPTVGTVLEEKGIKLYPKDLLKPGADTKLAQEQKIEITRAFEVSLEADGKHSEVVTTPVTVENILDQAGIVLGEKDLVQPDLNVVVQSGTVIKVSRIREEMITRTEPMAYRTEQKEDSTLERGIRRMVRRGQNGLKEETIRITYKDGKKIRWDIVSTRVTQEPVNQVIAFGVLQFASRGGSRFEFDRAMHVRASAYTYTGSRTSTGTSPKVGTVAVDPAVIPLGSRLYVEGYGYGRAEDTGGAIKGDKIDLFLESEQEARRWGRRTVKVYILK